MHVILQLFDMFINSQRNIIEPVSKMNMLFLAPVRTLQTRGGVALFVIELKTAYFQIVYAAKCAAMQIGHEAQCLEIY